MRMSIDQGEQAHTLTEFHFELLDPKTELTGSLHDT